MSQMCSNDTLILYFNMFNPEPKHSIYIYRESILKHIAKENYDTSMINYDYDNWC